MRFNIQLFQILSKNCPFIAIATQNCCSVKNSHRSAKLNYPSASRNSKPIADALLQQLDLKTPGLKLLEIASGSGQHAAYLAPLCANITFFPSEVDASVLESICAYADDCPTGNIRAPLYIDVTANPAKCPGLQQETFDYMYNSNMVHISPWACAEGLFRMAGYFLKPKGSLFTYGPYAVDGVLTPESNVSFDKSLRSRDADWGVRDVADLKKEAAKNGLKLVQTIEMPSNNKLLTWVKEN